MSRLSTTPFSILDLALAQHAEGLGFSRFWVAEHHNMEGIAVLLGYLAAGTSPLQLGSSGIMLPKHVPLAEKGDKFFRADCQQSAGWSLSSSSEFWPPCISRLYSDYSRRKKAPRCGAFFGSGVLVDLNLISLHPFLAFGRHERDGLAFAQAFEACAFD